MNALYRSALLATVPIVGIAIGLAGCKTAQSPGDVCSADITYSTMTGLMAANVKQPQDAAIAPSALAAKMSQLVKFTLPTVDSIDQATKKVTCHAVMTVTSTPEAIKAARSRDVSREVMIAMLNGDQVSPDALDPPVPINGQAADHISLQISYSVQPTADGSQTVVSLQQIDTLAKILFAAVEESNKPVAAASPVAVPDGDTSANDLSDQSASESANTISPAATPTSSNKITISAYDMGNISAGMKISTARQALTNSGWKLEPFNDSSEAQCWRDDANPNAPIGDPSGSCGYNFFDSTGRHLWIMADGKDQKIVSIEGSNGEPE